MIDLFDPETYASVRRPLLEATTLPPDCYTSSEFYQREMITIFRKCWNLVGRADYVKKPGDYFTHEVAGVSLIVIRGDDGEIRAFANTCRHRGARLAEGEGNCRMIRCPYHSWVYSNSGELRSANGMQETAQFDPREFGLAEVRLESWCGFLFVNLDRGSTSLREYLGNLDDYTSSYEFQTMVTVNRRQSVVQTNWKSYVENSMEGFHLPTVHQKTIGNTKGGWKATIGSPGNYLILQTLTTASRATLGGDAAFDRIATLSGPAADGAQYILVYPCTVIGADLDCMWFKQMAPDGPGRVLYSAGFCFPKASYERPDFDQVVQNYGRRFDLVISEDNGIAEVQFKGLSNPLARQGRLSSREPLVHAIGNWVLDRVVGGAPNAYRAAAE